MARVNKYVYLWVVQGSYGHGWEDLTAAEDRSEARGYARDYRNNDTASIRLIRRREPNPGYASQPTG
jgi:hypothetical protein